MGLATNFFSDDEIAVLGLNTARRFTRKSGRISVEQMAHIGRVFNNVPNEVVRVLTTYHPLAIPSGEPSVELAGRSAPALKAVSEAGIHLLLSGHHHRALSGGISEVGYGGSILVLHAGTAISKRTRGGEGNTYNLIQIDKERVSVKVMDWLSDHGFQQSRDATYVLETADGDPLKDHLLKARSARPTLRREIGPPGEWVSKLQPCIPRVQSKL